MKRMLLIIIGLVVMGYTSVYAYRSEEGDGMSPGKGMKSHSDMEGIGMIIPWGRIGDELGLTDKQKEEIKDFKHENKKEMIRNKSELKLKMLDLGYELRKDSIDDRKVNTLIDEISVLQKAMLKNKVNSLKKFKSILTKEQWEKLQQMRPKMDYGKRREKMKGKK